jgi:hypothetical protein
MRPEQAEAVARTMDYYKSWYTDPAKKGQPPRFLWNAKMRFGKTFAAYQLAKKMDWNRVLVLTFKPRYKALGRRSLEPCGVESGNSSSRRPQL